MTLAHDYRIYIGVMKANEKKIHILDASVFNFNPVIKGLPPLILLTPATCDIYVFLYELLYFRTTRSRHIGCKYEILGEGWLY